MKKLMLLALLLLVLPTGYARAASPEEAEIEKLGRAVPEEASELLEGDAGWLDFASRFAELFENIRARLGAIIRRGAAGAASIIVAALLMGTAETLFESLSGSSAPDYIPLAGTLAVAAAAVVNLNSFLRLGSDTLSELRAFADVLLPALASASAAAGGVTSAAAKYAASVLFMDVLVTLASRVVVPLIYAYTAAAIGSAAVGGDALSGAAGLLKWAATTVITAIVIAFVAYLTISGIVTGASDAVALRVAKAAISTALPVVGGIISDASASILAGAGVLKNAVGVFGMLAVTAICALPILNLLANYMFCKAAAGVTAAFSSGRIAKLASSIGTAFGMMTGVTGAAAVMLYFSMISMIKAVPL